MCHQPRVRRLLLLRRNMGGMYVLVSFIRGEREKGTAADYHMAALRKFCDAVWCGVPTSRSASRPRWPTRIVNFVWFKSNGRCHHCKVRLQRLDPESQRREWHIDHHPIPYRLIVDQCCCGVTDPLDPDNLVASCAKCNMGHAHETGRQWIRCHRPTWIRIARCAGLIALVGAAGYIGSIV